MSWLLTARSDATPANRVEARSIVTALLATNGTYEAESISVHVGRVRVPLGSLVTIRPGTDENGTVRMLGDFSRWDGLGFGLSTGRLIVEGSTGTRTAAELAGGTVEIHGDCGDWTGAALAGGRLIVRGDAGDWLGANWPGASRGMAGGEIVVHGRAGSHVGVRMRRGAIAVAGDVGEGIGRGMIAGSILLGGRCQGIVGLGMKRGTIVLRSTGHNRQPVSGSGFPAADSFRPLTLGIQLRHIGRLGWKPSEAMAQARVAARYLGDRLAGGIGEIFVLDCDESGQEGDG